MTKTTALKEEPLYSQFPRGQQAAGPRGEEQSPQEAGTKGEPGPEALLWFSREGMGKAR